jgi:hypothetical protein
VAPTPIQYVPNQGEIQAQIDKMNERKKRRLENEKALPVLVDGGSAPVPVIGDRIKGANDVPLAKLLEEQQKKLRSVDESKQNIYGKKVAADAAAEAELLKKTIIPGPTTVVDPAAVPKKDHRPSIRHRHIHRHYHYIVKA